MGSKGAKNNTKKQHLPHSPNYGTLPSIDEHIVVGETPLKKVGAEDSA